MSLDRTFQLGVDKDNFDRYWDLLGQKFPGGIFRHYVKNLGYVDFRVKIEPITLDDKARMVSTNINTSEYVRASDLALKVTFSISEDVKIPPSSELMLNTDLAKSLGWDTPEFALSVGNYRDPSLGDQDVPLNTFYSNGKHVFIVKFNESDFQGEISAEPFSIEL